MYKLVKVLGRIVTYCLCAITINKINVTESLFLSYFIISPIINELLWLLSYYTCNKIIYQKLNIDIPAIGSIGYTISYVVYAFIIFGILIVLKRFGIIPFANDFDVRLINSISQYFNNLIMDFSDKIVKVLQTTN